MFMILKKISLAMIACISTGMSFGQSAQTLKLLPKLVPPTPEAAAIARYGNYEVSEYTGVPVISIPLYNIKVGDLNVPISLNYHASGIKVSDIATRAGLGWSLEAGGTITRKVVGLADELPNNYFSASPTSSYRVRDAGGINNNSATDLTYLYNVDHSVYDVEPDIFSYSFPGHSGKFLFNQKDSFKAYIIPYSPIAITKTQPTSSTLNFDIKDESGIDYKFNTYEWTSTGGGISVNQTSAWKLSDMISSNNQDTIHFNCSSGWGMTDTYFSDYVTFNDNISGTHYNYDTPTYSTDQGSVYTSWQQLNEIKFKNGKVVIEGTTAARSDFSGEEKAINDIKVYSYDPLSNTYDLIKTIQFFHSYFQNGASRLRLDSLQILSSNNTAVQTYHFDYNESISLPDNLSRSKDYWGYFNNKTNTNASGLPTMVPHTVAPYNVPPSASSTITIGSTDSTGRDPDPNYMQADILQKITFPTGGYTQFIYETNQYLDDQNNPKYAGGLRVKTIKSYESASATLLVKTYKYGASESGYGRANFLLASYFFGNHQPCRYTDDLLNTIGQCEPYASKTLNTYFSNPTNDIEGFDGAPVVYPIVTEYTGDSLNNNGKIIYEFSDKPDAKTDAIGYGKAYFDSYQFVRGLLTNKLVYKNAGSNNYVLLSEDRKRYQFFPFQWSTGGIGLIVSKKINDEGASTGDADIGLVGTGSCYIYNDIGNYNYNNYNIVSGDNKLVADTSIVYDQHDPTKSISTITSNTYDDLTHLGLSQEQTTNSLGQTLKSTITYPYNYTTSPYNSMDLAHIWDKPVTETKFNGSTQLTQQMTNYGSFSSGTNYLPQNISVQIKSNPTEIRALFNSYDTRGNILEMQKTNDAKQSFIWDYQNMYPVAQVTGAAQSDIAYTSFEADGSGNWTNINSSNIVNNAAVTGQRSYKSSSFSISKSGLTSTTTYIVSYWSTSGVYTISGTQSGYPQTLKTLTINDQSWTCYLHQVTGVSTVTVSGNGGIDELRLYPLGAMMNTYSFIPLKSVSSQCDANNHLIFNTYDELGRLLVVRDENNNILKKYCYNYYNQSGSCSVYGNAAQSGTYTKSCGSGYQGSSVTYTVPANKYYSTLSTTDANSKASADVTANGQNYANTYGACTALPYSITGSNSNSIGYTVKFTLSNDSNTYYSFSLYSGASNINLGQIPGGTYTVQFQPGGMPVTANFSVNSLTMSNVNGATFYNVPITAPSTVNVY